jgi:anaerobic magnesium-protoporphyrin IX monomethyl ester cyclase
MLRFHLINGQTFTARRPHAGLGYLAAVLKKAGHVVKVSDYPLLSPAERAGALNERFDVYGLTSTSFGFPEVTSLARTIRKQHPRATIVVGGPHASIDHEDVLTVPEIDCALTGECEHSIVQFAEMRASGGRPDQSSIPGLVYRAEGTVCLTPPAPPRANLDDLPFPDWDAFPMHRVHQIPVLTSRGCPHKCIFCAATLAGGRKWRARSPGNVVDEIERNLRDYRPSELTFSDDNFNVGVDRAVEICAEILRRGLRFRWNCQGFRADHAEPGLLRLMRKTGCTGVAVGIESANPGVLRNVRKGETVEQLKEGIRHVHEAGIWVRGLFMIGNPGDSVRTTEESIQFAEDTRIEKPSFSVALPCPGTQLWDYVNREGRWLIADYRKACHLSDQLAFDTPDFPVEERVLAIRKARAFQARTQVGMGIMKKLKDRVLRGEYFSLPVIVRDLRNARRIVGAVFDHRRHRYDSEQ